MMRSARARAGVRRLVVLTLTTLVGFGHAVYPAWLLLVTRRKAPARAPEPSAWPAVTVIVPAYRESGVIASKVADVESNGYPGRLDTLVVADDPETAQAARATAARVIAPGRRLGKAAAINAGVRHAGGDIVVLTDANAQLATGSLARMVRWFEDPTVAGVAGEKRVRGGGESLYWRFESRLKRAEALQGTTIGLVGELAAFRRSCFEPLPERLAVDDLWLALDLIESGGRIAYEPEAVAFEDPSGSPAEVWERRTRVVSGGLDVLWRRRSMLGPGRGTVAVQLWGHRLVRTSAGPLAHLLLLVRALARARRSPAARLFLAAHAAAGWALWRRQRGVPVDRVQRLLAEVGFLQLVALGGLWRYVRGDRPALWPKADRTGSAPSA